MFFQSFTSRVANLTTSVCSIAASLTCCVTFATACGPAENATTVGQTDSVLVAYEFDRPDASFELPNRLREISGLTVLNDSTLAAVQDEKGDIFTIRIRDGVVLDRFEFAKDGDFEAIELVEEDLYVLRSDGDLYHVTDWANGNPEVEKFETRLREKNDTEGLAYDAELGFLLIACKEDPGIDVDDSRAIYAFDLRSNEVLEDPVHIIKRSSIPSTGGAISQWISAFTSLSAFKPSGIAIHPSTGDRWIISSVDRMLVVLTSQGRVRDLTQLPKALFPQPEGIAFLPNGDLFISNEGNGGRATLLRFHPIP